jgi:hypothetical protein
VPSPNGKEIAISRGEILLPMPMVKYQRINTPEQERHVQWSPDKPLFTLQSGESWDLYRKSRTKEEAFFYAATLIKEEN